MPVGEGEFSSAFPTVVFNTIHLGILFQKADSDLAGLRRA